MSLRRLFNLLERGSGTPGIVGTPGVQTLSQEPWRPLGPDGWSKAHGNMTATVQISRRGDGSATVTSVMGAGIKARRKTVAVRDEAEAIATAERMKLEIDSRAL